MQEELANSSKFEKQSVSKESLLSWLYNECVGFVNHLGSQKAYFVQVSGEISLACSWRVTPLDVVTMKVKQQQAEVDHKEEILALLQARFTEQSPKFSICI